MNRTRVMGFVGGAVAIGAGALETVAGRRLTRRLRRRLMRTVRYQRGRLEGLRYRMGGREPRPDVDDHVLADRVRSVLGPLEHRLDLPHVHVQSHAHEVLLHGEVASEEQARELVEATKKVPGVLEVHSHLHVGLFAGDSRPSEGARHPAPSEGLVRVISAVRGAGVAEGSERAAARSVLSTFVSLLPKGERGHFLGHLPKDLRQLAAPPRPRWVGRPRIRRLEEFSSIALASYDPSMRDAIVESVLGAVRALVPEEASDVAAVLPSQLRDLWRTAVPL